MTAPRTTDWPAVAVMVSAGVFAALHIGKLPPALPLIREELRFGLVEAGFALSLFNLIGMSCAVLIGGLADRIGRRGVVMAGILSLALGGSLAALAESLQLLLVSRAFEGLGFIAVAVALPAAIFAAAAERDRLLVLSIWSIYTPLGMAMAIFITPAALDQFGWRGLWWTVAAAAPAMALAVFWAMNRVAIPRPVPISPVRLSLAALAVPGFLMIALTFLAYAFQWMTLMVWLPTFLTESLGLSLSSAALVTSCIVVLNAAGCLLGGWFLRRGASARSQIYAGSVAMGLTAAAVFLPILPDIVRIGMACLFSLIGGLVPPCLFNMVPRVSPKRALVGTGNGMLLQGSALGQFIGAPVIGFVVAHADGAWSAALLPMLVACILMLGSGLLLGRIADVRSRGSRTDFGGLSAVPPEQ